MRKFIGRYAPILYHVIGVVVIGSDGQLSGFSGDTDPSSGFLEYIPSY